jgi:cytochrome c peroxidase
MGRARLTKISAVCSTIAVALLISAWLLLAQNGAQEAKAQPAPAPAATPIYNPYPPGILPADLTSELLRVQREVAFIEHEAIGQLQAIPPPTLTGNPPILQNTGVASVEILGKLMNFDLNISPFKNTACASCHMPYAGFSGPIPSVNLLMIAYPGSAHFRAGKRTAQRYTYSSYFPPLQFDPTQGAFFGGNFWDSRATGYLLRAPDAEQSQFPPVDPNEMGLPDTACITFRLSQAVYRPLFEEVWGAGSFAINFPSNTEQICDTPNAGGSATPVNLSPADRTRSNDVYDHWAQSLSAFEHSLSVSPFTSKFDAFLKGTTALTTDEMAGYNLFRGKANCNSCHLDGRSTAPAPTALSSMDTGVAADTTPVFTCFGSANLGLPKNPRVAFYFETTPDFFGFTPNPGGFTFTDFGLGTFLRSGFGSAPNPNVAWRQFASVSDGKMQTSTARDVALVPLCPPGSPPSCRACPTTEAPGPYFQKEFFHNGYIKSLKQLVHFYNTRDVFRMQVESNNCPPGTIEKVTCWPSAEVPQNQDMTVGNLHLTDTEENQIVAFLQTLTDGFTTPYPDINTFTGACMTGGNASTQGNSSLISAARVRP